MELNLFEVGRDGGTSLRARMGIANRMLASSHWLLARYHDMMARFEEESGNLSGELVHRLAVLSFFDAHLQRPSLRRALLLEQVGVLQRCLGDRLDAVRKCSRALEEMSMLLPPDHEWCADARETLKASLSM
eukprot:NODE_18303_length_899_cov_5.928756.p1 GENE.NODE_18303_length_899_cov_5.928756~~NODE_18303_length_899_cov_5.928756.p1  ORF type:complete len:132 (-),score=12.90 NODE_18303_length_899_cov_5.928756:312-707(-)